MRQLAASSIVIGAMALACPALAQDRNFYIGGDVGVAIISDADFDFAIGGLLETETDGGHQADLFAGYDFGGYRVELEAIRTEAQVDEITAAFRTPGQAGPGAFQAEGDINTQSVMANIFLDFAEFRGFELFAGAGLGVSKVEVVELGTPGNAPTLDDEERPDSGDGGWRTTWQVSAGARRALTDRIDAHLRYRYMRLQRDDDLSFIGFNGVTVQLDALPQHSVMAGLSFRF